MVRSLALVLLACALAAPAIAGQPGADPRRAEWQKLYERPEDVPFPAEDKYTDAKASLGRMLFFDPILSGDGARSCSSCHNPALSWGDGLARSIGAGEIPMPTRAPTLIDVAWIPVARLGRALSRPRERRLRGPDHVPHHHEPHREGSRRRRSTPIPAIAMPSPRPFPKAASRARPSAEALATFERGIVAEEAPFDRWIGGDTQAISDEAKHGFDLFNGKAGCAQCHAGWNFTDGAFYDIGTGKGEDIGRGHLFANSTKLHYAFKVPTLRDVARRAPFMHDGSEATLADVIELYNRGGIDRPSRSELIKPLKLSADEKAALIAFLDTLTGAPAAVLDAAAAALNPISP